MHLRGVAGKVDDVPGLTRISRGTTTRMSERSRTHVEERLRAHRLDQLDRAGNSPLRRPPRRG